jgi:hypothetical protein
MDSMSRIKVGRKIIALRIRGSEWYKIDLSDFQCVDDLRQWVFHLEQKNWFGPQLREQFIAAVVRVKGWDSAK